MAVSFVLVWERGVFLDFRHVWDLLLSSVVQNGEYPPDLMLPGTVKLTTKRILDLLGGCAIVSQKYPYTNWLQESQYGSQERKGER